MTLTELFGEPIHTYTRKQAIDDGVLVDVSDLARQAGIKYPVAMTVEVWAECVEVPHGVTCQDETGRLWDILWMLSLAARRSEGSEIQFGVYVRNSNRAGTPPLVKLKAMCGPGDDAEPVITIMFPNQD